MKTEYFKRKINYFEIKPILSEGKSISEFNSVFKIIKQLQDAKHRNRFFEHGAKMLYMTDIKFMPEYKQIKGKLLNIRMDVFPELMNTVNDVIRDIEAAESEGIVESSHFILSYKGNELMLSLEFNQYGPRITDFIGYLTNKGSALEIFEKIDFYPMQRDDLDSYRKRINNVSMVTAKVHKDNWKRIQDFDKELFDAFKTGSNVSDAEYVTLVFSYNYRDLRSSMKIRSKIMNIIGKLINDKTATNVFNTLKVKAEDEARNNKIREFDLLNLWVKSEIKVEKKLKSRAIVSADIFQKMQDEFYKEFAR